MTHTDGTFTGAGGVEIFWQCWAPDAAPRARVVLAHGASEHSARYAHVGTRLAAEGFALYALDHRGHGRSGGPRALVDRLASVIADLDALVEQAGVPVFLFGHSMGGCVATQYALTHPGKLRGLVLSSPLAALEAAPLPLRLVAQALSRVAPRTGLVAVDADGISRDPEEVRAYKEDPLVYHGKLPARTITELAAAINAFPGRVGELTMPLLIVHGTADRVVPITGAEMIAAGAASTDLIFSRYEGGYHELFNEVEPERSRVLDELVEWLVARA